MYGADTDEQLQHARAVVADLESERSAIAESTAAGPDDEHDAEGSTVAYERARVDALLAAALRRLADLEAQARGPAGPSELRRCDGCGQPIPAERLAALPGTIWCLRCVAEGERRRLQLHRDA